ncbi:MAG TPA: sensor domain-containing protein [Propionibacteriaceae bacterium]|nr:sensor domain-containing protein [Propionibacteriaceae bacterium]
MDIAAIGRTDQLADNLVSDRPDLQGIRRRRDDSWGNVIRRSRRDFGYVVGAFVISVLGFVVSLPIFAVGAALSWAVVGLFILLGALIVAGGFARFHRNLLAVMGYQLSDPIYPVGGKGVRGRLRRLGHAQSWRDLLHVLISLVLSLLTFPLAVTWVSIALGGVTYWFWSRYLPEHPGLATLLGFPGVLVDIVTNTVIGVIFVMTAPFILRGLVSLHGGLAHGVLVDQKSELRQQVTELTVSRAAAGDAELHTLRKLERDLHDGPQQRLVRLGMDISSAQRRLTSDPARADVILQEAFRQSQEALAEIRTLSRGIAPPILTERGLQAAITALASRGTVPTTVDVPLVQLSEATQNAAYFVIAESLANMEKHSHATSCTVEIRLAGERAVLTITDDGVGGAAVSKGHGLAGLLDRLSGVDGLLTVTSPVGGPTRVTATVPVRPRLA